MVSFPIAREFTDQDQALFAKLSGDYNPIHMDALKARRLLFGEVVVHGVHNVIWVLYIFSLKINKSIRLKTLEAKFIKPVFLQKKIYLQIRYNESDEVTCKIFADKNCQNMLLCKINFSFYLNDAEIASSINNADFSKTSNGLCNDFDVNHSGKLTLALNKEALTDLYPHILDYVNNQQLAFIITSTRLVGMKCPGLNSLYIGIKINFDATKKIISSNQLNYNILSFNKDLNAMMLALECGQISATVACMVRPSPVEQMAIDEILPQVARNQFKKQQALIIGGSRGLGELTTKFLACGGAEKIILTYQVGAEEAQKIVETISPFSPLARCFQYDILAKPKNPHEADIFSNITHCYYYASTKILTHQSQILDRKLLTNYLNVYLYGLERVVLLLKQYSHDNKIKLFNPSTIYIDQLQTNFAEYIIVKSGVEIFGKYLEKHYPNFEFINMKLPKMQTDQTASLIPESSPNHTQILLNYLNLG